MEVILTTVSGQRIVKFLLDQSPIPIKRLIIESIVNEIAYKNDPLPHLV